MTLCVGLILLASSCLASCSSGCAATLSDLLSLCGTGQYLDTRTCTCRNCTYLCPANQIVRRLCSPVSDSVCGPFFEFHQQKTKTKKKKKEGDGSGAGLEIGQQGRVYSDISGPRNSGELPLYVVDVSVITVKPFVNQPKDANDKMGVHSAVHLALLMSAAAAAFLMLVAAVSAMVFVTSRKKKTQERTIVASSADYRRIVVSPDEGTSVLNRPVNRSVVHIESQLIWNSQRGRGVASLLGRRSCGNDYVRECDQKAALSTSDAAI